MKKTLKTTAAIFAVLVVAMGTMISSCAKDGKTGPTGPAGAPGTNGTDGNANVQQFDFAGPDTLTSLNSYLVFTNAEITAGLLDSSMIMVYYSADGTQWNVAGGCGPGCQYQTIMYTDQSPFVSVYLRNTDGTSYSGANIIWYKERVLIIKANVFRMAHANKDVDFNNYESVRKYFKLNSK